MKTYTLTADQIAKMIFEIQQIRDFAENCRNAEESRYLKEDMRDIESMSGCILYTLLENFSDEDKEELYELSRDFKND